MNRRSHPGAIYKQCLPPLLSKGGVAEMPWDRGKPWDRKPLLWKSSTYRKIDHFLIHGFSKKTVANRGRFFATLFQTVGPLLSFLASLYLFISLFFKRKEEKKRGREKGRSHGEYYRAWDFWRKPCSFSRGMNRTLLSDIKDLREKAGCNHGE